MKHLLFLLLFLIISNSHDLIAEYNSDEIFMPGLEILSDSIDLDLYAGDSFCGNGIVDSTSFLNEIDGLIVPGYFGTRAIYKFRHFDVENDIEISVFTSLDDVDLFVYNGPTPCEDMVGSSTTIGGTEERVYLSNPDTGIYYIVIESKLDQLTDIYVTVDCGVSCKKYAVSNYFTDIAGDTLKIITEEYIISYSSFGRDTLGLQRIWVEYQAGDSVVLEPGFAIDSSVNFQIDVDRQCESFVKCGDVASPPGPSGLVDVPFELMQWNVNDTLDGCVRNMYFDILDATPAIKVFVANFVDGLSGPFNAQVDIRSANGDSYVLEIVVPTGESYWDAGEYTANDGSIYAVAIYFNYDGVRLASVDALMTAVTR